MGNINNKVTVTASKAPKKKTVWMFIDSYDESGSQAIKGIYDDEIQAKIAIADYVLKGDTNTDSIELVEKEVLS